MKSNGMPINLIIKTYGMRKAPGKTQKHGSGYDLAAFLQLAVTKDDGKTVNLLVVRTSLSTNRAHMDVKHTNSFLLEIFTAA
jgi:hypothetical protein